MSLLSDLDLDFDLDFTLSHFKITLVSKNFQRYVSLKLCTDMHFDGSSSNVCIIIMTLTFSLTLTLPFFIFIERHTNAILNLKDQKYAFCSFKKCWDGEVMDMYSVVWPDWVYLAYCRFFVIYIYVCVISFMYTFIYDLAIAFTDLHRWSI